MSGSFLIKANIMLLLSFLASLQTFSQVNTWQSRQRLPANSRFLSFSFSIGSKGYLGAGFDGSTYYKDFWEYDPGTNTWSQKADFGGGLRAAASAFSVGTKGYAGTGDASGNGTNDLWEYNPSTNVWTRKADLPAGTRTVAQGFTIGSKGYIGLGRTAEFATLYNDFWEYDPSTNSWNRKADFAGGARYATSGFTIDTKGYIGTGTDYSGGGFTFRNDFWEYNQLTNLWTRKADFAGGARELGVGFSIGTRGYIGTGSGTSDFWEYNPSSDGWLRKADFGGGGKNMATGFSLNGKGYLGTGAGGANDFWQYTPMATPPSTIWARHPDGGLSPYTTPAISTDSAGNTYVTGAFSGTLTFPTSPTITTLTSAGDADVFIAKYDATGNVLWAKRAGGSHAEVASAIKANGLGVVYIAGSFVESTDFEGTVFTNAPGSSSLFIAAYSSATGQLLWVRQGVSASPYSKSATDIAVDKAGDAYITGQFEGTITFAPLSSLTVVGWWDIYIVKYNTSGVPQWQTSAGSSEAGYNLETGNGIAVDQSGNVFVTGLFNGSSTNPTYFGSIPLVSSGGGGFYESNFFLAKYNPGTSLWEWAVEGGGTANDNGKNVSLDTLGNVYVSGYFEGSGTFGSTVLTSTGGHDFFIAKYSANGDQVWIHPVQGAGYFTSNASKVDANGNLYFGGTFDGTVNIGDQALTSSGFDNTYVSAWNNNGEFQWVKQIPGDYYSHLHALDVESNGNLTVATVFASSETFDCTTLYGGSFWDMAIAKLGYSNGTTAPTIQASSNNICSGNSSTLSIASGNLNNATDWKWYTGSCGGTLLGSGSTIIVNPTQTTSYYARSEGGCAGPGTCGTISISVDTSHPVINSVTSQLAPNPVNTSINLTISSSGNLSSANINWADGSTVQTVQNPGRNLVVPHIYTTPGVYTVLSTVTNTCGLTSATNKYQYIVVYDPNGSYVTGGGWINSPTGAYRADVTLTGKASFGFESRYLKGATVPSGNTEFKYQTGNLNFKSLNYQWLVVSGSKAQFKGTGTINGSGNYGFLLSAVDGDLGTTVTPDLFRIKIWDINNNGAIVYDNQFESADDATATTQIGGGSIVIHSATAATTQTRDVTTSPEQLLGLSASASPNPSSHYFTLNIQSNSEKSINIRVLDVLGREVESRINVAHSTQVTIGHNYKTGVYLVEVMQGDQKKVIKLIKE